MEIMKVEFIKKYRKWAAGDVDDFKDKKANFLIRLGWAKEYVQPKKKVLKPKIKKKPNTK